MSETNDIEVHKSREGTRVVCSFELAPGEVRTFRWAADEDGLRLESILLHEPRLKLTEARAGMYAICCSYAWSECGSLFTGVDVSLSVENPTSEKIASRAVVTLRRHTYAGGRMEIRS